MPYVQECRHGATQGVLRSRCTGGFELEVHEILSATVRAEEVNAHLHAHTENTGARKSVESDDVAVDDGEEQCDQVYSADLHESMTVQQDLIGDVPPCIAPTSWMVMVNPASSDALKAFEWKGERLAVISALLSG